jgi:hypothetical protein
VPRVEQPGASCIYEFFNFFPEVLQGLVADSRVHALPGDFRDGSHNDFGVVFEIISGAIERSDPMPSTSQFIVYVGGGTLGFLFSGVIFFVFDPGIGLGLMLFSLVYLLGGSVGFWLWNRLTFE